jgi:3-dehydroquinate dehydratase-2
LATKQFAVINGPNLNLLGTREPEIYGSKTLDDIVKDTEKKLKDYDVEIEWFQSNIEGELVEKVQQLSVKSLTALVINPAAYSHTSVALLDALKMLPFPVVEVHLSNTHLREEFRSTKMTAKASSVVIEGLGSNAYFMGILSQLI